MRQFLAEILSHNFSPTKNDERQLPRADFYYCGFLAAATLKNWLRYRPSDHLTN